MSFFCKRVVFVVLVVLGFFVGLVGVFYWQKLTNLLPIGLGHKISFENQNPKLRLEFDETNPELKKYLNQIGIWDQQGIRLPDGDQMSLQTIKGNILIQVVAEPQENVKTYNKGKAYTSYDVKQVDKNLVIMLHIATDSKNLGQIQNQQLKQDLTYLVTYVLTRISNKFGSTQQGTTNLVDMYLSEQKVVDKMQFITLVEALQ